MLRSNLKLHCGVLLPVISSVLCMVDLVGEAIDVNLGVVIGR